MPRRNGANIALLGVICHGVDTSKACFRDNANVPEGAVVPITELTKGNSPDINDGGTSTDCRAGENPFVIHPNTALDLAAAVPVGVEPDGVDVDRHGAGARAVARRVGRDEGTDPAQAVRDAVRAAVRRRPHRTPSAG